MLDTRRQITGKVSIVGHRGAPACAPENTLASFREGYRQGADIIELDVQLTADGHVVAFHDDELDRTTNGQGPLARHTLEELQRLDAGSWFDSRFAGEPIPKLEQVLAWAKDRIPLFIELKYSGHSDPSLEGVVIERVQANRMADQVMIISFDHPALHRVKGHAPHLATGALYAQPMRDPVGLARAIGASAVMPLWHLVSATEVAVCHDAGLAVHVWGDGMDYRALILTGVDCVNADYPAEVRREFFQD